MPKPKRKQVAVAFMDSDLIEYFGKWCYGLKHYHS